MSDRVRRRSDPRNGERNLRSNPASLARWNLWTAAFRFAVVFGILGSGLHQSCVMNDIRAEIEKSEARLQANLEKSEARLQANLEESEARLRDDLEKSEARLRDDLEKIETRIQNLEDRLDEVREELGTLKGEFGRRPRVQSGVPNQTPRAELGTGGSRAAPRTRAGEP